MHGSDKSCLYSRASLWMRSVLADLRLFRSNCRPTLGFLPCHMSHCWFQNECFNPVLCLVFCRANRSLSTSFLRAQMSIFTLSYPAVRISLIYYLDKNSFLVTWHVTNELVWKLVISRLSLQSCPIIHILFFQTVG